LFPVVVVVFDDPFAVAGICEGKIEDLRVTHALLKPVAGLVEPFDFNDGDRRAGFDFEQVIRALPLLAALSPRRRNDATVRKVPLFDDLLVVLTGSLNTGRMYSRQVSSSSGPKPAIAPQFAEL
jgi:hypothetical protein